jgi:CheY-like chemotaxis protein
MSRLLVIDDCDEFRETLGEMLKECGHEVAVASGPAEAESLIEKGGFELFLCDLVMPADELDDSSAMVGVHFISYLAKKYPEIPVVAISGELTGDPLEAVRHFGARGALSKPFSQPQLLRLVREVLHPELPAVE